MLRGGEARPLAVAMETLGRVRRPLRTPGKHWASNGFESVNVVNPFISYVKPDALPITKQKLVARQKKAAGGLQVHLSTDRSLVGKLY